MKNMFSFIVLNWQSGLFYAEQALNCPFNAFHSIVHGKIYSLNTIKHNCLIKILVTGSLILYSFRKHVSVIEQPSSGLQWTKNATCETFF